MPDTHITIPMARLIELETAEHERDILRAEVEALRDCRTCRHYTTASGGCMSVLRCIDASAYQRATPIKIWEIADRAEAKDGGA